MARLLLLIRPFINLRMDKISKTIIYQMLPRLWGNDCTNPVKRGALEDNGTGKFSDIDDKSLAYIKWLGCTHVWYTGVIRHATKSASSGCMPSHPQFVKGEAGSPYAVNDYYDVNPYLASDPDRRMDEFRELVERTHEAGLKVIIDFVPNHVARDYTGGQGSLGSSDDTGIHWQAGNDFIYYPDQPLVLPDENEFNNEVCRLKNADFNGEYRILPTWIVNAAERHVSEHGIDGYDRFLDSFGTLLASYREKPAKATGNNCFSANPGQNDWYETIKLNYCDFHTGTWDRMLDIIMFWASKGVDGFRCDMVELVPAEFFRWLINCVKKEFPEIIFIAEVYKKDLYRKYIREVGFDFLYDKSGLYDTLRVIVEKNVSDNGMPVELWQSATGLTRSWQFLGDLQPYMLNFLENHDEQRFASPFFGKGPENTFAPLHVSLMMNTSPFMIYFGEEMGERGMDEEGFSGPDGRTSIFDWWSIASVRKLRKAISDGSYRFLDPERLASSGFSAGESAYFCRFASLVRFASAEPAVSQGTFYDLCYCNYESEGFDRNRHFAFLRDHEDDTYLVAVNFSASTADMCIKIPPHAFEWMKIPVTEELNTGRYIRVSVPPMDGVVMKITD